MLDKKGREVSVGDVVSSRWYDYGTTLLVMSIHGDYLFVRKRCRGRKIFPIRFPKCSSCRRDFMIVNR